MCDYLIAKRLYLLILQWTCQVGLFPNTPHSLILSIVKILYEVGTFSLLVFTA